MAIWNPAAAAIPLIEQSVGMDKFLSFNISSAEESNIFLGLVELLNYFKSCPEQNTGPSASKIKIYFIFIVTFAFFSFTFSYTSESEPFKS